ncbi:hypothetical protein LOTGIDRAFT_175157 [Lottia gigantea]|uniref:G-protein coupled receptors family 1 profile domain-containing protein n=1 Tax=Lottia gigantea TaxID=225164 RepID=V4AFA7_LOTGI|nr:hypothetical protein LOTGIDRAFT_175157 [Lottia gigantea]ESO95552.1 hypothetical protein LOTGIDRAFT_175157 [Lottia gigantea]
MAEDNSSTLRSESVSELEPRYSQPSSIDQNQSAEAVYQLLLAHHDYRMSEQLHTYLTPVLVGIGVIGNLLAIIILRRGSLRKSSVCFYLAVYGVFNILNLAVVNGTSWLCYILQKPCISTLTDWSCGLWTFIMHLIVYGGIWIVVAMSIDRFVYLCLPSRSLSLCTVFSAKIIVVFILVGLVVISVHTMWTYELQPQGCYIPYHQKDLHTLIWPWISATCFSYLPLALLFIFNVCISISLCLKKDRCNQVTRGNGGQEQHNYIALAVSVLFFSLTMPATIINLIDIHFPIQWLSVELLAQIELTKSITDILTLTNIAGLLFVLLIFSKAFRHELYQTLKGLNLQRESKNYELSEVSKEKDKKDRKHVDYEICNTDVSTNV